MQFLIKSLDDLVGKGLEETVILQLVSLNIPWMLVLAVPMGVLFGTLMAFGSMSASHEVTVIKASGGSLFRMMRPVILISILLTLFMFWFNDVILPESNHRAKTLISDIKKKKPTFILESGQFSANIDGYTILSRKVDSLSGMMFGVTIYDKKSSRSSNIINANEGEITLDAASGKMILNLFDGELHQSEYLKQKNYRIVNFEDYTIYLDATGFNFNRTDEELMSRGQREMRISDMEKIMEESVKNADDISDKIDAKVEEHFDLIFKKTPTNKESEEVDILEAYRRVEKMLNFFQSNVNSLVAQNKRYDEKSRQYDVEINKKYSIPVACFIFIFVGCPMGIITRGGNFGISAAISLGFYIIYWTCLIGGEKLADRGHLDPSISMWLGNMIVGLIGIIVTLKVSREIDINPFTFIKNLFSKS